MLLSETDVARALEKARSAFPNISRWEFNNVVTEDHPGFTLWGAYVPAAADPLRVFYVTFDAYGNKGWQRSLTIGMPAYFWSSANVGDARLIESDQFATLEEAMRALKREMVRLASGLSAINTQDVPRFGHQPKD